MPIAIIKQKPYLSTRTAKSEPQQIGFQVIWPVHIWVGKTLNYENYIQKNEVSGASFKATMEFFFAVF